MTIATILTAFIALGGVSLSGAFGLGDRRQAQFEKYQGHTLNYTMECGKHVHYHGQEHFYCHEGESVAYMSTVKTNFTFPKETLKANIFIKTKYVFKLYLHGRTTTPVKQESDFSIFAVTKDLLLDDVAFQFNNTLNWNRHALLAESLQQLRVRSIYINLWVRSREFAGLVYYMNTKDVQSIKEMTFDFNARLSGCASGAGLFHSIGNFLQLEDTHILGFLQMKPARKANFTLVAHAPMPTFLVKMINSEYCVHNCCYVIDNTLEENIEFEKDEVSRNQWCDPCFGMALWPPGTIRTTGYFGDICGGPISGPEECTGCCREVLGPVFMERSSGTCFDPLDTAKSFGVTTYEEIPISNFIQNGEISVVFVNAQEAQRNFTNLTFTPESFAGTGNEQGFSIFDDSTVYFTNIYLTGVANWDETQVGNYSLVAWNLVKPKLACIRFELQMYIGNESANVYFMLMGGYEEILIVNSIFNVTFDQQSLGKFGTLKGVFEDANISLWNSTYQGAGASALRVSWVIWELKGQDKKTMNFTVSNSSFVLQRNTYGDHNVILVSTVFNTTININKLKVTDMNISVRSYCLPSQYAGPQEDLVPFPPNDKNYIKPEIDDPQDFDTVFELMCRNTKKMDEAGDAERNYSSKEPPRITSAGLVVHMSNSNFTLSESKLYQNITFDWNSDRNGIIYAIAANETRVNVTQTYVCYNVTFATFGRGSLSGRFPGAMASSRHMDPSSLVDRVNVTIGIFNSTQSGTGFLGQVFRSNWTVKNIIAELYLNTTTIGVGFIGLLHNNCSLNGACDIGPARPENKFEYNLSVENYTGNCTMSATHGGGNVIGKCDFWYMIYVDNVTLWGKINSTQNYVFGAADDFLSGTTLRKIEQRCNGLLIGHILAARYVNVSNVNITNGSVNVSVTNAGAAHGLLLRGVSQNSHMYVKLSNYYVGSESPIEVFCHTKDYEGCGGIFSYAYGGNYSLRDMNVSVYFTSHSGRSEIDAHYEGWGEQKRVGGVCGYVETSSVDLIANLNVKNFTLSFRKEANTDTQVGAVTGMILDKTADVRVEEFVLEDGSGINGNKCAQYNVGRLVVVSSDCIKSQ